MHVYCLFCQTQRCGVIAAMLEKQGACRALSPRILQRERKQGRNVEIMRDLLPGYVFVYSEDPFEQQLLCPGVRGVIRCLGTGTGNYELSGADRDFAMRLYDREGTISAVRVFREGDRVTLADPLFMSCKGRITRVDNRKQRARVDFDFENNPCHTWIAFEMIDKE